MKHLSTIGSAVFCLCFLCVCAQAQGPLKRIIPAVKKAVQKTAATPPKKPMTQMLQQKAVQARREKLKQTVSATAPNRLKLAVYTMTTAQIRAARMQYYRNMREYASLKKHIEARLFYKEHQHDRISSIELADLNFRLSQLEEKLAWSAMVFSDSPLSVARRQLTQLRCELDPFAVPKGLALPAALQRKDRKFNKNEFYLYGKDGSSPHVWNYSWVFPFLNHRRARNIAAQLPPNLHVAVLNDSQSALNSISQWQKNAVWGKNLHVRVFENRENFLAFLHKGGQVDMLITDLVMPNGGGFYLAAELRQQGYKMPILALSAFGESEKRGQKLFSLGFDGMISTRIMDGSLFGTSGYLTFVNAIRNYYAWKKLRGWNR